MFEISAPTEPLANSAMMSTPMNDEYTLPVER